MCIRDATAATGAMTCGLITLSEGSGMLASVGVHRNVVEASRLAPSDTSVLAIIGATGEA